MWAVCPPIAAADAALASDNDNPAAPNAGKALHRRFRWGDVCFAGNRSTSVASDKNFAQSIAVMW
jgi:hypothetical protein